MLAVLTTRPFSFFTKGKNVNVTSIKPQRLTSHCFLKSSTVSQSGDPVVKRFPALFSIPQRPETTQNHQSLLLHLFGGIENTKSTKLTLLPPLHSSFTQN